MELVDIGSLFQLSFQLSLACAKTLDLTYSVHSCFKCNSTTCVVSNLISLVQKGFWLTKLHETSLACMHAKSMLLSCSHTPFLYSLENWPKACYTSSKMPKYKSKPPPPSHQAKSRWIAENWEYILPWGTACLIFSLTLWKLVPKYPPFHL